MNQPGKVPAAFRLYNAVKTYPDHPLLTKYQREYIDFHQISHKEWRNRLRILSNFHEQLAGDFDSMTADDVLAYAGGRLSAGRHINTVRFEMNRIRWFANWLYGIGVLTAEQILAIRAVPDPRGSTGRAVPRPYSREDLDRFYATLNERWPKVVQRVPRLDGSVSLAQRSVDRWVITGHGWRQVQRHAMRLQIEAVVALGLHCALRAGEIYDLDINGLHYDLRYLVVKGKRSDQREKLREVPFTTPARDAVKAWLEFRALLRPRHKRTWLRLRFGQKAMHFPMDRQDMYQLLPHYVGDEWRLHRFRHTAATERLRAGADIEIISRWLGHSNTQMTLGYLEIVKADIARVMAQTEGAFVDRIAPRTTNDRQEKDDGPDQADISNRAA